MIPHELPVLRANDVEKTIVQFPLDARVEYFEELRSHGRLRAAQAGEKGRLEFSRQVAALEALVSIDKIHDFQELSVEFLLVWKAFLVEGHHSEKESRFFAKGGRLLNVKLRLKK